MEEVCCHLEICLIREQRLDVLGEVEAEVVDAEHVLRRIGEDLADRRRHLGIAVRDEDRGRDAEGLAELFKCPDEGVVRLVHEQAGGKDDGLTVPTYCREASKLHAVAVGAPRGVIEHNTTSAEHPRVERSLLRQRQVASVKRGAL